LGVENLFLR